MLLLFAVPARADFPYGSGPDHKLAPGQTPNDLSGDGNDWKFAATPEAGSPNTADPKELFGVRGAHVADPSQSVDTAWQTTTGRPDVTISVLDSGIKWNERDTMLDLRDKLRLNKGELPTPQTSGPALEPGVNCASYGNASDPNDANHDGVFNALDYLCDPRVNTNEPRSVGPTDLLDPQDLIIAFENGVDEDGNGFVDDIAGWDFLDNDNDAYDDVQYGHGTGEAKDSSAEANNGVGQAGACPSCMFIPLRVGDSFIADVNRFAQAVIYAVDNNVLVVQEALGTLNNSHLAREAVDYAYRHGVSVIASAADEAAQHHNWPSNYAHTIVVNSADKYDPVLTPSSRSYIQFNGCTNFSSKVTLAIPSSSCSSNATGLGAGFAGLIYSAALNAQDHGRLSSAPNCTRANGQPCILTANEVRQLMASGSIDGTDQADDINFATQPEPSCNPPTPGCTDPNALFADTNANRPVFSPLATTKSYPARKGFDEFYGYGRANMVKAVEAANGGTVLPEAEISSPDWYAQVSPHQATVAIRGQVYARGRSYSCKVYIAPGSEPNNGLATDLPPGDFQQISSNWCDGSARSSSFDGALADVDVAQLKSRFPPDAGGFNGREPPPGAPNFNGRPNTEPYGFTVRVIVTSVQAGRTLVGQDRRNLYLHRDQDMLEDFPRKLDGDAESSPHFADLDGDNRNELIFATSDGIVHALQRDGTELPGWPVHGDPLPLHAGGHAFTSGEVDQNASYGAMLASVAVADIDRDGTPEVVAADMEGKLYVWNADGTLRFKREAEINYSGKPLSPHANVRCPKRCRTQHGFIGSPVVADLDGNGGHPEIIAADMDRHVYAWDHNGDPVAGFPVLVIDRSKISAIDPQTHVPTFSDSGERLDQGAIIDTPAVGDLDGDGKPEIVVGTNEEYDANSDGGFNAGNLNTASLSVLAQAGVLSLGNTRLYAIKPTGEPGGPSVNGPSPYLPGWPVKLGIINTELLPVVGEGVTGSPVIGPVSCPSGGSGPKAGGMGNAGPNYLWNPNGSSCYGQTSGHDNAMQTDFATSPGKFDTPAIPAVGHPTFGDLGGSGPSFLSPAAGLIRSLDVAVNEYQGGQDFLAAWDSSTGQFRPGFPSPVNDLQFITGPSIADIDGLPGEEIVAGTSSLDLAAFSAGGTPVSTKWPKLSTDWTVANPLIGSLGTFDVEGSARKVVVGLTRSGYVNVYATDAPACSASSWPTFHHDVGNSGDYRRDATLPGTPYDLAISGGTLSFKAPGDDLLCGNADHYEVVQSDNQITGSNFSSQDPVAGAPAPTAPGTTQTLPLPSPRKTFIGIRAVDEQGNVGPVATIRQLPGFARPKGATPILVSLALAYAQCTSPNRDHGPPLGAGSCNPPQQSSGQLTVGTLDANGRPANFVGSVRLDAKLGNIGTPENEADVLVAASLSDVRNRGDLSDYTGELLVDSALRITDHYNGPAQDEPATVQDTSFPMTMSCSATASSTTGGACGLSSSFNAIVPGAVLESKRAIWQLGEIDVFDGGSDGLASTTPNALFARQGLFAP